MPIYSPTGFLDVTNATLRGSKIVTTSNVGIANLDPLNTLSVGSNLQVEDTGSNVLTVRGNAAAAAMTLGVITIAPSYSLEIVSNIGNTVSNTVQFTNATTGFVSASNIEVGTGNLFVNTTTGEVTVGEQLTVNNRADVTDLHASNLTVDSALYANAATGRVGVNTTSPGDFALDVHGTANVGALTATDVIVTGNLAVSGDIAAVRSTTVNVDDPIIGLANNNTSDPAVLDIGFVMARPSTAEGSNVAIIFDESSDTLEIGYTQSKHTDTTITMDDGTLFNTNIHGNVSVSNLNVGQFSVVAAYGLDHVTNENNSTGDTIISTNATTGLQTTANVVVGRDALVSGNVGIGTTNPGALLELSKATGSATISPTELRLSTRTNAADWSVTDPWARLSFYTDDVTGDAPGVMASVGAVASSVNGGENTRLAFFTAEPHLERMCVDRYGSVGIGTTSPARPLEVAGSGGGAIINLKRTDYGTGQGALAFVNANSNVCASITASRAGAEGGNLIFYTVENDPAVTSDNPYLISARMHITSGGNVGIGTASPNTALEVYSTTGTQLTLRSNSRYSTIYGVDDTGSCFFGNDGGQFRITTGGDTSGTGASERMRVDSSGNVGIGTASPSANMHIYGSDPVLKISDTTGSSGYATLWLQESDLYGVKLKYNSATNDFFNLSTVDNGTENTRMVVTRTGNVGIGTVSPAASLHVQGNLSILGDNTGASSIIINDIPTARWRIATGAYLLNFYKHTSSSDEYSTWASRFQIADNYTAFDNVNTGGHDGDSYAASALVNDYSAWFTIFDKDWLGSTSGWGGYWAGNSNAAYRRETGDTNPNELVFVGSGNKRFTFELNNGQAYFDAGLSQNAYDYAEYFEWDDGNPENEDRRGYSVVLASDGKIRKATSDDNPEDIIGAVSGTSGIIGDAAIYDWNGKYEVDEWGTRVTDEVYQLTWSVELENGERQNHSYDEDRVPEGLVVPENVKRRLRNRERINPEYDETQVYIPRDKRKEWSTIGLLGKVRVRDESPKHPSWKYLKSINGKELWFIK